MPLFDKNTSRAVSRGIGSFWTDIFGGADTIDVLSGTSVAEHRQLEKDIDEAVATLSRYKIPLFKEEIWKQFIVETGSIAEASRLLYKYQSGTLVGITEQTTVRYVTTDASGGGDGLALETAWTLAEGMAALVEGMQLRIVEGTYAITAQITLPTTENIEIVGANKLGLIDGTRPIIQPNTGFPLLDPVFDPNSNAVNNVVIRHIAIVPTGITAACTTLDVYGGSNNRFDDIQLGVLAGGFIDSSPVLTGSGNLITNIQAFDSMASGLLSSGGSNFSAGASIKFCNVKSWDGSFGGHGSHPNGPTKTEYCRISRTGLRGIAMSANSSGSIIKCTFYNNFQNSSGSGAGAAISTADPTVRDLTVRDCIIDTVGEEGYGLYLNGGVWNPDVSYTLMNNVLLYIEGVAETEGAFEAYGVGNIGNEDPLFIETTDMEDDDFLRPGPGSPALNAASDGYDLGAMQSFFPVNSEGSDGDEYIASETGDYFVKRKGRWLWVGNLITGEGFSTHPSFVYGGGFSYGQEQEYRNYYRVPVDSTLADISFITDQPLDPSVSLEQGIDFVVNQDDNVLEFRQDPESLGLPIVAGRDEDDTTDVKNLEFWGNHADYDRRLLFRHFGFVVKAYTEFQTEEYRNLINAMWDTLLAGPNELSFREALGAMTGVETIQSDGEIVQYITEGLGKKQVITDKRAYTYDDAMTVSVSAGDVLNEGDIPVDAIQIFEGQDLDDISSLTDVDGVRLEPWATSLNIQDAINFPNTSVATTYNVDSDGFTDVRFPIGGNASDTALFWSHVVTESKASGNSIAEQVNTNPLTGDFVPESQVPTTINPAQFLIDTALKSNFIIVVLRTEQLEFLGNIVVLNFIRTLLPPHVNILFFTSGNAGYENFVMGDSAVVDTEVAGLISEPSTDTIDLSSDITEFHTSAFYV